MIEVPVDEKFLYISPKVQVLITENPEAVQLLTMLTDNYAFSVQDGVDDPEKQGQPGYLGFISVGMRGEVIEIAESNPITPVLRHILERIDPEAARKITPAPHSPAVSRALTQPTQLSYQHSAGAPPSQQMNDSGNDGKNLLRKSVDKSVDYEADLDSAEIKLNGLEPESTSISAKWCSWFTCCCVRDEDQNPLLSSASASKPK